MNDIGPYETHAQKTLEPLRLWRSRNFGLLSTKEADDLTRLMEGVVRRAKHQDEQVGETR